MKQTVKVSMVLLGALTVAMWFGISSTNKKKEVLEGQFAQLEKEVVRKESAFEEVMGLITEVEDQIGTIVEKENLVHGQSQEPLNSGKKENIMREIAMIDDLIFRSNENMRTLSDKVKSTDIKLGVFEKRINALQADLTTRISIIGELKTELVAKDKALALLLVQTDSLSTTINAKVEVIGQKELEVTQLTALNDELNKSYLAVGTYEDLQAKGVIDKEGGFLGFIGRSIALQDDADKGEFMELDRRKVSQLKIQAESLSLVSNHPTGSYQILPGEDEATKILEITDPEAFWQISKFLVISKNSRASR